MKKLFKILIGIVLLLVVVIGATAIFISPVAKNYIEKHDRELIGRSIRMEKLKINIFTGRMWLTGLKIGGVDDSTTFIRLDSFDTRLRLWPLLRNRVDVRYVSLTQPDVKIYQRGSEFNFDGILAFFNSDTTAVVEEPSEPWQIGINNIAIRGGHIFYKDLLLDATWGLNNVDLDIPGVYFGGEKTDVGAVLNFAEGGSLSTKVAYDIDSAKFDIALHLRDLTLDGTLPYFRQSLNVSDVDGRLSADLNVRGDLEHLLSARVDGEASLAGFALRDMRQRTAMSIDSLNIKLREGDLGKMRFDFDRIYINGFSTFFEMTAKGNNLTELIKAEEPASTAPATAEEQASGPAPTLHIADFEIARSKVTYRDMTLHKPFEYVVSDIRMRSRDFSPSGRNNLVVDARMQQTGQAKLRWEGSIDDINNQNITLWLTNVALKDFTPFSEHFTAYPILQGNLSFRSQNVIRSRVLDGTNHLDVFEPKVDKKRKDLKAEMNIPLKLGLYVLKDRKGHVKMDLPVKGSLDSPEFSYKKIVLKAIGNVLLKVVTAPFSFLMGHKDNLEYIDIDPQQYVFSSEQYASFDKIAGMLQDKPDMHIALTQRIQLDRVLPKQAGVALRMAYANHLKALAANDTTKIAEKPQVGTGTSSDAANPRLSMIDYEKIQQLDIRSPQIMAFADSLLTQRGVDPHGMSAEAKALALYREEAMTQMSRMISSRDKALEEYMRTTHNVTAPGFRLQSLDSVALHGYKGRDRYTISLEVDGETVEVTPADSTATAAPVVKDETPGNIETAAITQDTGTAQATTGGVAVSPSAQAAE